MTDFPPPRLRGSAAAGPAEGDRSRQPLRAQWDPTVREEHKNRPRPNRTAKKQSRLGRFVSNYGWRAYAIPVLVIVTGVVVFDAVRTSAASGPTVDEPATAAVVGHDSHGSVVIGAPPGDGSFAADIPTGVLPEGGAFTPAGTQSWHVVPGVMGQVGAGTEHVFTYTVEVEDGIDMTGVGGDEGFARMVDTTLSDPRSWIKEPRFAFVRIDQGEPDFRISLTSQMTTRDACGYDIPVDSSCFNQGLGRVVLNEARWVRGAVAFQGDIGSYRQYQVNHEVGHAIGYVAHQPCDSDGGLAPVMMQQSFGTSNNDIARLDPQGVVPADGKVCRFNPWPYPRG